VPVSTSSPVYSAVFDAPSAGRLAISWQLKPRGARGKPSVLIARLSVTVQHAGATQVKLKLTRRYRQLLAVSQRATVVAKGTFTPQGRQATSVTERFTLRG
jgi:hypothetical protein